MTLKDQFDIQGCDSTLGYVGRAFRPAAENCVLVSMLESMGAVVIGKTNLPQSIMVCQNHTAALKGATCRASAYGGLIVV
jgi:amidase